jgi:hypothetical protein
MVSNINLGLHVPPVKTRLAAFDKLGVEIKPGTGILDRQGERPKLVRCTRARTNKQSGKVVVQYEYPQTHQREYYDKVFELEVREVPEDAKTQGRR